MSRQPKVSLSALIHTEVAPKAAAARDEPPIAVEPVPPASEPPQMPLPSAAPRASAASPTPRQVTRTTLRARSKQLSLYLELPVYDQLREIAHIERTKMPQLVVEGIDLLFRKRGQPPIRELMKKTNQG